MFYGQAHWAWTRPSSRSFGKLSVCTEKVNIDHGLERSNPMEGGVLL